MKKRKVIALITACPEEEYQQRVFRGVFEQCEKYGYNLAVFAMNVQTWHYFGDYLKGNENIYNLINYEKFDGVIVTTLNLSHNNQSTLARRVFDKINLEYKGPVISLDQPFDDVKTVYTDDRESIRTITNHVIREHGCRDIIFLTGYESVEGSIIRLEGYKDALADNNIVFDESRVVFGDFWYTSGEKLAKNIISGEISKPEAVVCANDHMAMGFINALKGSKYEVPRDIIVTGYDAIREAYINDTSLTTYIPDVYTAAAKAVNEIHNAISPDEPEIEIKHNNKNNLVLGESCGCKSDVSEIKQSLKGAIYYLNQGVRLVDKNDTNDITRLNESYMFETLLSQYSIPQVLENIDIFTYLIKPFKEFFLILREDFADLNKVYEKDYPDVMRMFIHRTVAHETESRVEKCFSGDDKKGERSFATSEMLPELFEPSEEPAAFFFSPVNFNRETFGYAVLKCDLLEEYRIGSVYRNWIRNVGNALEMIRVKSRLIDESIEDNMTGLLNRRGMDIKLADIIKNNNKKQIHVIMIDMDRLKMINDNYGHEEGDYGIITISRVIKECTSRQDICVRTGGDEFLVIGFSDNAAEYVEKVIAKIRAGIERCSLESNKPYILSASLGYAVRDFQKDIEIEGLVKEADENMYVEKRKKHVERV